MGALKAFARQMGFASGEEQCRLSPLYLFHPQRKRFGEGLRIVKGHL
jgi:hypothetical protein